MGLGRNLERIEAIAKSSVRPIGLIEIDLAAEFQVLEETLASLGKMLGAVSSNSLVFISNASNIEPIAQAVDLKVFGLERAMRTNCIAPLNIANFLTKTTKERGFPLLILNISSGAACRPIRGWQAYCTTKAAFKMGLDVVAAENPHVQVVHFDPGVMDTSMQLLIRKQQVSEMPEVEDFCAYLESGLLKPPITVAVELINIIKSRL